MNGRLQDKVAVITGGNSGIGLATAELFAREGAKVAILGRDAKSLQSAGARIGSECLVVQGNVSRIEDLDRLYGAVEDRFGMIDVLVANAGVGRFAPIAGCPESLFDEVCGVNFKGAFFTVSRALPYLCDGASVILVGAADADKIGRPLTVNRRGSALDMARGMLFLASDDSSYCLGSDLMLDGGLTQVVC